MANTFDVARCARFFVVALLTAVFRDMLDSLILKSKKKRIEGKNGFALGGWSTRDKS